MPFQQLRKLGLRFEVDDHLVNYQVHSGPVGPGECANLPRIGTTVDGSDV